MRHHTKDKGDLGLGFIIGDLLRAGIQIALPLSEHLPFDLIAVSEAGQLVRVQVKYRAATRGTITCGLDSVWSDSHGSHHRPYDPAAYDALALYCPEPSMCCYLRVAELPRDTVCLRLEPPKNNQVRGIRLAADYRDPLRVFERP